MDIKEIVETSDGKYEIRVEVNSKQHQFIFQTGLRFLIATGALPVITANEAMERDDNAPTQGEFDFDQDTNDDDSGPIDPSKLN